MTKQEAELQAELAHNRLAAIGQRMDVIQKQAEALERERQDLLAEYQECSARELAAMRILAAA